jgi:hypothetical protein
MAEMSEEEILKRLAAIRAKSPTGKLKLADCVHGFPDGMLVVYHPSGTAFLVTFADLRCECGKTSCHTMVFNIDQCPLCGADTRQFAPADVPIPLRNYVIGRNNPVDIHLYRMGAFAEVEAEIADQER